MKSDSNDAPVWGYPILAWRGVGAGERALRSPDDEATTKIA